MRKAPQTSFSKLGAKPKGPAPAGSAEAEANLPLAQRWVRKIRTFDPSDFARRRPYRIYLSLCGLYVIGCNYYLHLRMNKLYPDWDQVKESHGRRMTDAKIQELADIRRYNQNVEDMRASLRGN